MNEIVMKLKDHGSLGNRESGKKMKEKILHAITENDKVIIDFKDARMMSSGFADEAFGRLFVELGQVMFGTYMKFRNLDGSDETVLNRAIWQRKTLDDENEKMS